MSLHSGLFICFPFRRLWSKLRLLMSEGRQSQVVLLDDRRLDILIKPKLYAGELLDMVASHFSLKEKEYFGLAYADDTGHYSWLQLDRRVLEHEFPKRSSQSTLILYFKIKYFVESITHLRDSSTVEAFYLQTQSLVYNGDIEVTSDKAFQLAALILQATHGDFTSDDLAKQFLKKLPVLPTSALVEHPSLKVCEDRVIEHYKLFRGQSRGSAIVNYMRIAESLPTYGVHYYEVKDKAGIPWWLGISCKGICQYDHTDKKVPRKLFLWKQLENLYFRDRKFSIEVYDIKRITASRKTFGAGSISVYVWFSSSPSLTKCIWSMAIAQHQFYLDRKHNKSALSLSRNFSDIADELSHGSYSTETSSLGRSVSSLSLPALKIDSDSCDETLDTVEMFVALKARKEALEAALHKKCEELKRLCLREGELTGALPPEMPLTPGEQIPVIKKKIGPTFPIKDKLLWKKKSKDEEELARLELEYEIQTKIVSAAVKLLNDSSVKKNIRRQRKISHQKALSKLKEIEQKLFHFRKQMGSLNKESASLSDTEQLIKSTSANMKDLTITFSPTDSETEDAKNSFNKMTSSSSSPVPLPSIIRASNSNSVPSSPSNSRHLSNVQRNSAQKKDMPKPDLTLQGYTPSSVYQTQTSYRSQQYPTFSMRSPSSYSSASSSDFGTSVYSDKIPFVPLTAPYRNRFESTLDIEGSNLYSVPTQRTSQAFDTQDDILATIPRNPPQDLGLISRHNSLDRNRRHSFQKCRKYFDQSAALADIQRPSSVQSHMYDNFSYKNRGMSMFPYQEQQQQLQSHQSDHSAHHPHHFHHHRHDEGKSLTHENLSAYSQSCETPPPQQDTNMYQENLKLYAADAMYLGERRYLDSQHKQKHISTSPSLKSRKKDWIDFHSTDMKNRTPSVSPYDSGLSSPSSSTERSWPSKSPQNVPSSSSMGNLQYHAAANRPGSNVDIVTYGHFQPYWEETKPYETSDFYKYSTKHRKQHQAASQNLHAKLSAWKAHQANSQILGTVPPVMSPVLERSRTSSPACTFGGNGQPSSLEEEDKMPSEKIKKEGHLNEGAAEKSKNLTDEAFHDDVLEWYSKQEKGKKTTLV
ncbi:FERM domain-containing protein 4A-like isoform X2 [Uloborus diversus]|uniref:FERM domain-containing protein 4A-like isoform X2 n=1 Tax=Uloborus diversus TaxID=327109 RepID=UPI002408F5CF|nr:FERM domain-containing protein 4A-like isoform X2 [Uloborus diversus]